MGAWSALLMSLWSALQWAQPLVARLVLPSAAQRELLLAQPTAETLAWQSAARPVPMCSLPLEAMSAQLMALRPASASAL